MKSLLIKSPKWEALDISKSPSYKMDYYCATEEGITGKK